MSAAEAATGSRPYRMGARARSTEATGRRILEAAETVFDERPTDEFTLTAVAERAGVSVQTVIRRFGSRKGLIAATLIQVGLQMRSDHGGPRADDPRAATEQLIDHYDRFGPRILRLLAEEERNRAAHAMTDYGRNYHRRWCEGNFAPALAGMRGNRRERRLGQFVAVTDVYFWKILRQDRGLESEQAKLAIWELIEPLLTPS